MKFSRIQSAQVVFPEDALEAVFDECDRYDADETGGRVLGTYELKGDALKIEVKAVLEPGPNAQRSSVSFFQDGDYQENVFRRLEANHPEIEHLGNWHTHHVNGYPTLSGGDITTYQRTVNHENHNTDFFYALLVVSKNGRGFGRRPRYAVKHYLLWRDDDKVYEIPETSVAVVRKPLWWPQAEREPKKAATAARPVPAAARPHPHPSSENDRGLITQCYPGLRPFSSKRLGYYWRGPVALIDGTEMEVVALESNPPDREGCSVTVRQPPKALEDVAEDIAAQTYGTIGEALVSAERTCNKAVHRTRLRESGHGARTEGRS